MLSILKGRMNRASYWSMLALVAVLVVGAAVLFDQPPKVAEVVLLIICVPRLHDLGRSGWWAGGALLAEIVIAFAAPFVLGGLEPAMVALGVVALILAGLLIWLGALRGDSEPNRFGPPPKPGLSFVPRSDAT